MSTEPKTDTKHTTFRGPESIVTSTGVVFTFPADDIENAKQVEANIVRKLNEHDGLVEQRDHLVEIVEMVLQAHNGRAPLIDMALALLIAPAAIARAKQT